MNNTHPTRRSADSLPINMVVLLAAIISHAQDCKDSKCSLCRENVRTMDSLPPLTLARALEQKQAAPLRCNLGTRVLEKARGRFMHMSQRAERDYTATAALFAYHKHHFPQQYRKH